METHRFSALTVVKEDSGRLLVVLIFLQDGRNGIELHGLSRRLTVCQRFQSHPSPSPSQGLSPRNTPGHATIHANRKDGTSQTPGHQMRGGCPPTRVRLQETDIGVEEHRGRPPRLRKGQVHRRPSRQSEGRVGAAGGGGTRGQAGAHLPAASVCAGMSVKHI